MISQEEAYVEPLEIFLGFLHEHSRSLGSSGQLARPRVRLCHREQPHTNRRGFHQLDNILRPAG